MQTTTQPTTTHTLRISLFAGMAAAVGRRTVELAWDDGTAAALRSRLAVEFPAIAPLLARSTVAIGDAYVADDARVPCGVDVAIIPPVSGG
jgi:molybdopterin converting factor small subunit